MHSMVASSLGAMMLVVGCLHHAPLVVGAETAEVLAKKPDYRFDGNITREVLENYLDRSVTMAFFLVTGVPERGRGRYPYREDDIRLIRNIGAKFIGRAIYRWGGESRLNEPGFWSGAKDLIDRGVTSPEHLGIRGRRFGPEVAVIRGQVAEVLRDGFHRRERFLEPLEGARERAVGNRQDFASTDHGMFAFCFCLCWHTGYELVRQRGQNRVKRRILSGRDCVPAP